MATAVTELLHRLNGQHYKGEMKDQVPHGEGECTLTDGTVYKGQFYEGLFHGRGELIFANGDRYPSDWSLGALVEGQFEFSDGLQYPANNEQWHYCSDADRRFYSEHLNGLALAISGAAQLTNALLTPSIPYNCYDVGDGYLYINDGSSDEPNFATAVYEFASGLRLRDTNDWEVDWAQRKCRVGDNPVYTHRATQAASQQ